MSNWQFGSRRESGGKPRPTAVNPYTPTSFNYDIQFTAHYHKDVSATLHLQTNKAGVGTISFDNVRGPELGKITLPIQITGHGLGKARKKAALTVKNHLEYLGRDSSHTPALLQQSREAHKKRTSRRRSHGSGNTSTYHPPSYTYPSWSND